MANVVEATNTEAGTVAVAVAVYVAAAAATFSVRIRDNTMSTSFTSESMTHLSPNPFASSTTKRLYRVPLVSYVTPCRTLVQCLVISPALRCRTSTPLAFVK